MRNKAKNIAKDEKEKQIVKPKRERNEEVCNVQRGDVDTKRKIGRR